MAAKVRPEARIFSRKDRGSIVPSSSSLQAFDARTFQQDPGLPLAARHCRVLEPVGPLPRLVEPDHHPVDQTICGSDLEVAAEILGHQDTFASEDLGDAAA
jgi:hypothetical protein